MAHWRHFCDQRARFCCSGLQFGIYELVKVLWIAQRGLDPNALIGDIANLVMGLISGTFTQSLTCPLKTVAIRIGSGVTGDKTMAQAARNIYKEGGIGGFFAGNLTGLISQPGTIAFSFYFFERFRFLGGKLMPGADQLIAFLAGGLAQSAAVVIMYPFRAAKDKLQGQKEGTYSGMVDVWSQAYRSGGLFGDGGVYGGCIQDAVGNFTKKGLTFWSRDLFVALFMAIFAGGSGGSGGEL